MCGGCLKFSIVHKQCAAVRLTDGRWMTLLSVARGENRPRKTSLTSERRNLWAEIWPSLATKVTSWGRRGLSPINDLKLILDKDIVCIDLVKQSGTVQPKLNEARY